MGATTGEEIGTTFALGAINPNPTSGTSMISYSLQHDARIRLSIYDLQGREIAVLANGEQSGGAHVAAWQGSNIGAGVYFVRLRTPTRTLTRRMVVAQ